MQILYQLPEYYKDIISHLVDTKREVELLDEIFKKHHVKSVLDVACGIGRHAIPLTQLGYSVTGIDFSPHQIQKSKEDAKSEVVNVDFVLQDANTFEYYEKYDAAICMWTTLGEEPLQYWKVIKNVFKALKKSAIFVIDNKSWEYIPQNNEELIENTNKTEKGIKIHTRIHDRYTEHFRIRDIQHVIDDKEYNDLCVTHILRENDWLKELSKVGFRKFEVYRDYKLQTVDKPHHLDIVAIK